MAQSSNREQLLRGALECLQRNGYARTTARDIATASGANLASIGYHFGSKGALLNEALMRAFVQWTEQLGEIALDAAEAPPPERLKLAWEEMLAGFREHRMLVVSFVEAMAQVERSEELRAQLAAHYRALRAAVAALLAKSFGNALGGSAGADQECRGDHVRPASGAQPLASILIALCDGFALQWLIDPQDVPDVRPLLAVVGGLLDGHNEHCD